MTCSVTFTKCLYNADRIFKDSILSNYIIIRVYNNDLLPTAYTFEKFICMLCMSKFYSVRIYFSSAHNFPHTVYSTPYFSKLPFYGNRVIQTKAVQSLPESPNLFRF
jgi:hypothetical protein